MKSELQIFYKTKSCSEEDILRHLEFCNLSFIPPLSSRINLVDYAKKIHEYAVTFEAWKGIELVGLVATYFNKDKSAFITNVSVESKFKSIGIGSKLIEMCLEYANRHVFESISLEVNKNNQDAIRFYMKHNFIQTGQKEDNILLNYKQII